MGSQQLFRDALTYSSQDPMTHTSRHDAASRSEDCAYIRGHVVPRCIVSQRWSRHIAIRKPEMIREPDIPNLRLWLIGVVVFCVAMNMLSRGYGETFAVFLLPLSTEFEWTRTRLTGAYSTYLIGYGLCAPLAGQLFSRFGARWTYVSGLLCLGLGYALASRADSVPGLYLSIGVLGALGAASIGMIPASALIRRWFPTHFTTALGFAYAGLGAGVFLFAPGAQLLIESFGWRAAYLALGVLPLLLAPLIYMLPWRRLVRGRAADVRTVDHREETYWNLRRAVRTMPFWGLFIAFFGTSGGYFMLTPQLVAYMVSLGYEPLEAAAAFGVIGMLSITGMVGVSWAADRYGSTLVVIVSYIASIGGVGMFLLLSEWTGMAVLVAALCLLALLPAAEHLLFRQWHRASFQAVDTRPFSAA